MAVIRAVSLAFAACYARITRGFQAVRHQTTVIENDIAADNERLCLGNMCGKHGPRSSHANEDEIHSSGAEFAFMGRRPFCGPNRTSPSRLVLMPFVVDNHGVTALASVLMSSSEITTLCSADTWQCDSHGILAAEGVSGRNNWLKIFSRHWDLEKHVLLAPHPDIKMEYSELEAELQGGPPEVMKRAGIQRVFLLNVIMWRPVCMGVLSSSTYNETLDYARLELKIMDDLVAAHKEMLLAGRPVLVISLADLLWNPVFSKSRLQKMIPCIGEVDFSAVPELHHYNYHKLKSSFKVNTSVLEFGKANPPSECDYDIKQRSCGRIHDVFKLLPDEEQMRAKEAASYLDMWSQ